MIKFQRYTHVNDFIDYYFSMVGDPDVKSVLELGISNENEARVFTSFIIKMIDAIHDDAENQVSVLGDTDNSDVLPDISYEITNYMRTTQYFYIWDELFD